jgi:hypothetical protein
VTVCGRRGVGVVRVACVAYGHGGCHPNLLADIRWEREARYWDGIAASANASGVLNFGGGAKDSGGVYRG